MPRDSAWRTSPIRRSQVSAGAWPGQLQPSAAVRPPGPAGTLLLPPVAELVFTFCQGSPRHSASAPGGGCSSRCSRGGRCASQLPHCVHTRERPLSLPLLSRPCAPLLVGSRQEGRGAWDNRGWPQREGRSQSGAPTPRFSLQQTWKNCRRSLPSATV